MGQGPLPLKEFHTEHSSLKFSIVGYQNIEQPIKVFNNGTVNLSLQESFEALEEVVVKAGGKKKRFKR